MYETNCADTDEAVHSLFNDRSRESSRPPIANASGLGTRFVPAAAQHLGGIE